MLSAGRSSVTPSALPAWEPLCCMSTSQSRGSTARFSFPTIRFPPRTMHRQPDRRCSTSATESSQVANVADLDELGDHVYAESACRSRHLAIEGKKVSTATLCDRNVECIRSA